MCSIVINVTETGVFIGANRDEMLGRPWSPPAEYWPGITAARDEQAGGTWLAVNKYGVMAAVLNRTGTLGPAPGKRSRGELPLDALSEAHAVDAAAKLAGLESAQYRSFNVVVANNSGGFIVRGLEVGKPVVSPLPSGVTIVTSGEPNDVSLPRIARHWPRFRQTAFERWPELLADDSGAWEEAMNIPERNGFGTVSSSVLALTPAGVDWKFCPGRPGEAPFAPVAC